MIALKLLPRQCPVCRNETIIGHGRRLRQSHDDQHKRIWVRRGICRPCGKTFTALPDSLPDGAPKRRLDQLANRLTKILAETRKLKPDA